MKCLSELCETCRRPSFTEKFKKTERTLLSVFMRVLDTMPLVRAEFLGMCGYGAGRTCSYESFMEATFPNGKLPDSRPDGLLICQRGKTGWSALVEAKAGDSKIRSEQIQEYADLASQIDVDAIISISNEFARNPTELPFHLPANKMRKRSFYHFSWPEIRAMIERMTRDPELTELEGAVLHDVVEFMWDPSSGIVTFDQMPKEWSDFVQSSGVGVGFSAKTPGITEIVRGWHQERRDLRTKLAHATSLDVDFRHEAGVRADFGQILNYDRKRLADEYELTAQYYFKTSKVALSILAELQDRKTTLSVDLPVPDGKGAKALTTWIAKVTEDFARSKTTLIFTWKGKGNERAITMDQLHSDPLQLYDGQREPPKSIRLIRQVHDVKRFRSRKLFITDLEALCLQSAAELKRVGLIA